MYYQNNNDYMRDAFYYSVPENSTYQNGWGNNIQGQMYSPCHMTMQNNMQTVPISNLYPQVYKIINPVANRVISNSNSQFLNEDVLNNMVDTVYNIVEGDISTLSNTMSIGDDTVTQGPSRTTSSTTTTTNTGTRQTTMNSESTRNTTISGSQNNRNDNQLLRDLIKIIIIKEILSRQMGFPSAIPNTQMNSVNFATNPNNFIDPRIYGLI